ncbi:MAG: 3-phosphoserine/phosphohydroxythreonine transaminase [Pseudomonadota bacterium]|nr:3-phosphoserine/phosphohydroxythreonine transaminase [Pseudomonadota bacterium]
MSRVFNFSAGPAALPTEVLEQAQRELLDWNDLGTSVMEISHRSKPFVDLAAQAEQDLRDLMGIPENYKVLFLQGGATHQFTMIPQNLTKNSSQVVDFIETGHWSEKAIKVTKKSAQVHIAASSRDSGFTTVPRPDTWNLSDNAAYLHYTPNETIHGVEFDFIPEVDVPIIADMSSNILSRPMDVSQFGIIYAGAQKNIGPSGLTLVIIREDLLEPQRDIAPLMTFKAQAEKDSMLNTPPTFAWYLSALVFKWLKAQGGLAAMESLNERKAQKLYDYIDTEGFYSNKVEAPFRSWMNVPFFIADDALHAVFVKEAEQAGLQALKGHRALGGLRASIYNAVPEAAVDALIEFMKEFVKRHG